MKNFLIKTLQVISVVAMLALVSTGIRLTIAAPSTTPGTGSGAISTDGSGNVGVGTSTPVYKLDVSGQIRGTTIIGNLGASNITAAVFGSGNYAFPGSLGVGTSSQVGLPQTLSVYGGLGVYGSTGQWATFQRNGKQLYVNANWSDQNNYGQIAMRSTDNMGLSLSSKDGNPEYLFVSSAGNVGVGTTTPSRALHVAQQNPSIALFDTDAAISASNPAWIVRGNSVGTFHVQSTADFTTITDRLVINNSGNVGIGTSTPASKFVVTGGGGSTIDFSVNGRMRTGDTGNSGGIWVDGSAGAQFFGQQSTTAMGLWNGGWRLIATNTGNIGVGTTTPAYPLTVVGNINSTTGLCIAGDCRTSWSAVASPNGWTDNGTTVTLTTGTDNVGLNVTPSNKLHVGGNIGATGWVGAGCEGACETASGYSLLRESGMVEAANTSGSFQLQPSTGTYGSLDVIGSKNGYSGIKFNSVTGNGNQLMVNNTSNLQGFYKEGVGWAWYFSNGELTVGGVNTASAITGGEVYTNQWFRNNAANTGLYNQVNGRHLYSDGTYWTSTANAILFRNGYGGGGLGYVYTDGSNFGLLNNAGSWAVQIPNGTQNVNLLGTVTVGGGTGKINVGTVDPLYTINGKRYATYLPAMTGQKEETTGTLELEVDENGIWTKEIDFAKAEDGSDIWLFGKVTDINKNFKNLVILLTPSFNGKTWYELDEENKKVIVHGEFGGEVSYRLTAPRFDGEKWGNASTDKEEGFNLDKLLP